MRLVIEANGRNLNEMLVALQEAVCRVEDGIYEYSETNIHTDEPEDIYDIEENVDKYGFRISLKEEQNEN